MSYPKVSRLPSGPKAGPDALVPDNVLGHRLVEKQATVYLRYLVAVAVGIVAVSKALDLLLAG